MEKYEKMKEEIKLIIDKYFISFNAKTYIEENEEDDILMQIFHISSKLKKENKQYWSRELGMIWQYLLTTLFMIYSPSKFKPSYRIGKDEPFDLIYGKYAIDTKYRIGSGDAGTLKKFKQYGKILNKMGYTPLLLILRNDNLPAAITACEHGGWQIKTGEDVFDFIKNELEIDFHTFLKDEFANGKYKIIREE